MPETFEQIMKRWGLRLVALELDRVERCRKRLQLLCQLSQKRRGPQRKDK